MKHPFQETIENVKREIEIGDDANIWLAKDTLFGEWQLIKKEPEEQTKVFNELVRAVNEYVQQENQVLKLCITGRKEGIDVGDDVVRCLEAMRVIGRRIIDRAEAVAKLCHDEEMKL